MESRIVGSILILLSLLLGAMLLTLDSRLEEAAAASCDCTLHEEGALCPHEEGRPWQSIAATLLLGGLLALGLYLLLFDKGQRAIVTALEEQKRLKLDEERFAILLKGLNTEERAVLTAVKEQDGITQHTLRLRTDLHKSKLSITLDSLEKKGLVARATKGKTKQVFLKIGL